MLSVLNIFRLSRTSIAAGLTACVLVLIPSGPLEAQRYEGFDAAVPTPMSHFGFEPGESRKMANWDELTAYYEKLAASSARITVDTLGPTTDGRPFVMLTITSPENHARLDELHDIQMKLADPRRIADEAELERLIGEGKTVVLITHGIHATEVGGGQTAARLAYRMAASPDAGIQDILDNVIFLQVPSLNPDGLQWVAEWYNQWVGTEFEAAPLPWLYHFYVGHDNNRDWFTFAQVETQHTVIQAHNAWHPQIVHDIHQMGGSGARIFFPPYINPIDKNVDPAIVTAVNQLGSYMAAELTAQGKKGVVINAIYDGFHPGRQYQHYHAGARILSETASARLASPATVDPESIGGGREYDAARSSNNYPWPWEGGEWGLPDIVNYMESGALALLTNAARNREYWLRNFYAINKRAVDGWEDWPEAWVIPADQEPKGLNYALRILAMGDVEVRRALDPFRANGKTFQPGTYVIPMDQPYGSFVQTLLQPQDYPDLREYPGGPPKRPYDVTAHTLPLLMGFEAQPLDYAAESQLSDPIDPPALEWETPQGLRGFRAPDVAVYKGWQESMMAGWTRWVFDQHGMEYDTLHNAQVRAGDLKDDYDVILFQEQDVGSIVDGFGEGTPPEYQGGIGDAGKQALREFVENGGRLVAVETATELMIDLFDLPVRDVVADLPSQDFYIPGSILNLRHDDGSQGTAWYWRSSRAFEVSGPGVTPVAWYGDGDVVKSGWALGPQHVAGKPARLSARVGKGEVILFGFQPNYRSQTVATWPLLWKALADGWR